MARHDHATSLVSTKQRWPERGQPHEKTCRSLKATSQRRPSSTSPSTKKGYFLSWNSHSPLERYCRLRIPMTASRKTEAISVRTYSCLWSWVKLGFLKC